MFCNNVFYQSVNTGLQCRGKLTISVQMLQLARGINYFNLLMWTRRLISIFYNIVYCGVEIISEIFECADAWFSEIIFIFVNGLLTQVKHICKSLLATVAVCSMYL